MTLIKTMFMGLYLELKTKAQQLSGQEEVVAALHTLGLHGYGPEKFAFSIPDGMLYVGGPEEIPGGTIAHIRLSWSCSREAIDFLLGIASALEATLSYGEWAVDSENAEAFCKEAAAYAAGITGMID